MTQAYEFSSFVHHHNHAVAILQRTFDHDGEAAMLHLATRLGTPLDHHSYVFPDLTLLIHHEHSHQYEFWTPKQAMQPPVFRPAARGIHHDNPFPAANGYPELHAHPSLSAYGLVCLYREFSHRSCRNESSDNTDSDILYREFVQWLQQRFNSNRHLGPHNPHRFDQREAVALPNLHRAWNEATRNA